MAVPSPLPSLSLSCAASDPEMRFGLPAGPFTAVGPFAPLVLAGAWTACVYGLVGLVRALAPDAAAVRYVYDLLCARGFIPYVEIFCTGWCAAILWLKTFKIRVQRRALAFNLAPPGRDGFVLSPDTVAEVLAHLEREVFDPQRFVLLARVRMVLSNLRNLGRVSDVDDMLSAQADVAEGVSESSYNFARNLIWAVPVLGFIGTVLGLSQAIGAFGGVVQAGGGIETLKTELAGVTAGLSVSFDTTLLGLVLALLAQFALTAVKSSEERFLDDCRDYGNRQILGRLRVAPDAAEPAAPASAPPPA